MLEKGASCGELGIMHGIDSSATVRAKGRVVVYVIEGILLEELFASSTHAAKNRRLSKLLKQVGTA